MFSLYIRSTFYRLSVSYFLRNGYYIYAELVLEFCHYYIELDLSLSSKKHLMSLNVSVELEGWIFLHQLMESGTYFFIVALVRRLYCYIQGRLRELYRRKLDYIALFAESISGLCELKLSYSNYISCFHCRCVFLSLSSHEEHGTQFFSLFSSCIVYFLTSFERSGNHFCKGYLSEERVCDSFKYKSSRLS